MTYAEWLRAEHNVSVTVQGDLERLSQRAAALLDEPDPRGFWCRLEEILWGCEDLVGGLLLRIYAATEHGDGDEAHAQLMKVKL